MTFPAAVDLRSEYDRVYSQGSDCSCGPHALTAALDCMFERATGKEHRFDKAHLWKWAKFYAGALTEANVGTDVASLLKALNANGVMLGDQIVTGFTAVQTRTTMPGVDHFKHLLASGVPLVYAMRMPLNLTALGNNWRTHELVLDTSGRQDTLHFVCVVGYDDAAQRFCLENSWGSTFGDGGWFGVPYSQMADPNMWVGLAHVDIAPVLNKPVEGYKVTAYMTAADSSAFVDRAKEPLLNHLMGAFSGGVQSLIDECVKWGVSDKHLETIAGWERGAVRAFRADNPGLVWDGFVWDQL